MLFMERQMYDDHESEEEEEASDEERTGTNKKTSSGNLKGNQIRYEDFFRGDMTSKKSNPSSSSSSSKKFKNTSTNKNKGNDTSKKAKTMRKANDEDEDEDEDEVEEEEEEEGGDLDGAENSDEDFDENGEDDYDFGGDDDENENEDDDENESEDEDGTGERVSKNAKPKQQRALTTHEKREQRMAIQIAQIESKLLLPSSVFECNSTSGVGLSFRRAGPGLACLLLPLLSSCCVLCAVLCASNCDSLLINYKLSSHSPFYSLPLPFLPPFLLLLGELIAEKPWDMRGEIKSLERPENSLLEITAQVER